jgi:beta-glucosidase
VLDTPFRRQNSTYCMIPIARAILFTLLAVMAVPPAAQAQRLALDAGSERRIDALLARMTLAEKIGQLNLLARDERTSLQMDEVRAGRSGAIMNVVKPDEIRGFREAAAGTRLGIPLIIGLDAIHSFRITHPVPLAWAATWNPGQAARSAEMVAREAASAGINWTFGPMVDVSRDPRWGRVIEGAGEDAYLGSAMAVARTRGYRAGGLAVAVKHYVGYGAAESGRDYNDAPIPVTELFDRHLPPFKAAIDAGAETVMAAFNTVNGSPASADRRLLTGILRGRLGFNGYVTSDFDAIGNLINHGVAGNTIEAARRALKAGIDMDMVGEHYSRHLANEVHAERLAPATIDEAVRRVLRVKLAIGLFDRPADAPLPPLPDQAAVRAVSRETARQSFVLVKNQGDALPIAPAAQRVAVIGASAATEYDQSWLKASGDVTPETSTLLKEMRARARPGQSIDYAPAFTTHCGQAFADRDRAIAAARAADLVVLVLMEDCEFQGEGTSRTRLELSGVQQQMLEALAATGKPVVLVLGTGRPLVLSAAAPLTRAILVVWHPGTEGAAAIAETLFGEVAPSGKLPMSFPRSVGQLPMSYDQLPTSRPTSAERYTSRYLDEEVTPLYPFGWGLSYTSFAFGRIEIAQAKVQVDGAVEVTVPVTNTGARAGHEVVQLYVRQLVASRSRPQRLLKAFERIALQPGETCTVRLKVPAGELGFHDDDGRYLVEPGSFEVFVGGNSGATLSAKFELVAK